MAHPAGFEPATIRLEGGGVCRLNAANYKDLRNLVNCCDTKVTLLCSTDLNFA